MQARRTPEFLPLQLSQASAVATSVKNPGLRCPGPSADVEAVSLLNLQHVSRGQVDGTKALSLLGRKRGAVG
jgi:hypothetical protein